MGGVRAEVPAAHEPGRADLLHCDFSSLFRSSHGVSWCSLPYDDGVHFARGILVDVVGKRMTVAQKVWGVFIVAVGSIGSMIGTVQALQDIAKALSGGRHE